MNSKLSHAEKRGAACRVARQVLLAPASLDENILRAYSADTNRELYISAGAKSFVLFQYPADVADERLTDQLDLSDFLDASDLAPAEKAALLKSIFGFAARMLRLVEDPVLMDAARRLSATPNLVTVKIGLFTIADRDTAVAIIPARAGISEKDLLLGIGDGRLYLADCGRIHPFLAWDKPRQRLTTFVFDSHPEADEFLLIGAEGLLRVEVTFQTYDTSEAFQAELGRQNPDLVALLVEQDEDAALIINRLQRQNRMANVANEPFLGLTFVVETSLPLAEGLVVSGWFHDPEERIEDVTTICHTLEDACISDQWICFDARTERDGKMVSVRRFIALLRGHPAENVPVRVRLASGETYLLMAPLAPSDTLGQRTELLDTIRGYAFTDELLEQVYLPTVAALQDELNARQRVRRVVEFGPRSSRKASLIIPLYKQMGFLRSQMMAFSVDPFIRGHVELVYVLDDPTADLSIESMLEGYQFSFPLDVKLVVLERNGGYALANNMGVSQAEGEYLVLMNSDVIPARAGWLETGLAKLAELPGSSVVGPKLLYADDSLQHAGMYFFKLSTGYWQNFHFWKGYGRQFPPANQPRVVPAVTGACMMIRKSDYLEVGGFTTDYVIGDYEDSDLCLKLRERGGLPYYLPDIELYHFERQSMPDADNVDFGSTIYNRALHTYRWSSQIVSLMQGLDTPSVPAATSTTPFGPAE